MNSKIKSKSDNQKPSMDQLKYEIQKRAYEIYEARIRSNFPGDSISDWLIAEKEICEKYNIKL